MTQTAGKFHLVEAEEINAKVIHKLPRMKKKTNWTQMSLASTPNNTTPATSPSPSTGNVSVKATPGMPNSTSTVAAAASTSTTSVKKPSGSASTSHSTKSSPTSSSSSHHSNKPQGNSPPSTQPRMAPNNKFKQGRPNGYKNQNGKWKGDRQPFHKNNGRHGNHPATVPSKGAFYNGVFVPTVDPHVTAQQAKHQIEYYFTPDNLVRDTFLRQNMDMDGYVPVVFVANFQSVLLLHQDYGLLLQALSTSESIEMDLVNEKIRPRVGWQQWLWPNANGGYGLPRYLKMKPQAPEPVVSTPVVPVPPMATSQAIRSN